MHHVGAGPLGAVAVRQRALACRRQSLMVHLARFRSSCILWVASAANGQSVPAGECVRLIRIDWGSHGLVANRGPYTRGWVHSR